jgi:hypothetical protein
MIQANVADVIRRYGRLFADGRALFYPSPTLIGVTSRNVDELMPEAKSALSARPDLPIWRECRAFEQYISADKISSSHVVIDEYRQIANIGKAVASIEIPYICNVSPELFDQLLQDNQESLSKFRARTKRVIDDLVDSQSDLDSERIRKRFRRDVDDGVKELDSKLQVLRQSTALQQAGGLILTTVSTLAAISVVDIPAAAAKLLGSGGLGSMAFQYASYLLQLKALRRSPYHIVWQFRRNDPAKV